MNEQDIEALKVWYDRKVQKRFPGANDHAVSIPGATFLWTLLDQYKPRRVLEMGSGFSTLVLRTWQPTEPGTVIYTADHHHDWLSFTMDCLRQRGLNTNRLYDLNDAFRQDSYQHFDMIFIDHGPELITRIADSRWLASLLGSGGLLVFDDWRPRFANRITAALGPLGFTFSAAEHTRRYPRDKAIGVARKTKSAQRKIPALEPLLRKWRSPRRRKGRP